MSAVAQDGSPPNGQQLRGPNSRFRVAQDFCTTAYNNWQQCYQSWANIGGGTDGQAGAFCACMAAYRNGMIAAGCSNTPPQYAGQC
jgi:hypothetical protein